MAVSPSRLKSKDKGVLNEDLESEDLKRFRQEWLQELRNRTEENVSSTRTSLVSGTVGTSTTFPREDLPNVCERRNLVDGSKKPRIMSDHPLVRNGKIVGEDDISSSSLKKALDIYRRAVSHEQTGELDKALLLYRQAFKVVCQHLGQI